MASDRLDAEISNRGAKDVGNRDQAGRHVRCRQRTEPVAILARQSGVGQVFPEVRVRGLDRPDAAGLAVLVVSDDLAVIAEEQIGIGKRLDIPPIVAHGK